MSPLFRLIQIFCMFFICDPLFAQAEIESSTVAGLVKGRVENGVASFKGIPYGASTAGAMRFKPPHPVAPWSGVRDATTFGSICPQTGAVANGQDPATSLGYSMTGYIEKLPISEDCLVLNVWTPAIKGKRPVMVWFHGRGYGEGAGSEDWYDGTALAKRGDVVVVTVNHRLNIFGYLYLEALAGDEYAGSGMAGMLDAALSLQWVRDNIERFGGDPNNVTIFGESGGGAKVSTLLAMPSAKGLFHKAIIQSGAGIVAQSTQTAQRHTSDLLNKLDIEPNNVQALESLPLDQLLTAAEAIKNNFRPVMDQRYLPQQPFDQVATQWSKDIPIIIGTNKDEVSLFFAADPNRGNITEKELFARLENSLGQKVDKIIGAYKRENSNASPWDTFIAIESDRRFRIPSIQLAEAQLASHEAPLYMYLLEWETNYGGGIFKSPHAVDIGFVFSHTDKVPLNGNKEDRYEMQTKMVEAWIAFAHTGNPNHKAIPHWHPYSLERRDTMIFNVPSRIERDPMRELRLAW